MGDDEAVIGGAGKEEAGGEEDAGDLLPEDAEAYLRAGDRRRALGAYRDLRWCDTSTVPWLRERVLQLERETES